MNEQRMEFNDIQGLVARGHSDLPAAAYLLLQIDKAANAQIWLQAMLPKVNHAADKLMKPRFHIAFTYPGLLKLGLKGDHVRKLSPEFIQGMAIPYRSRLLGDMGSSEATHWKWGGPNNPEIHILLMAFAESMAHLDQIVAQTQAECAALNIAVIARLDTETNPQEKEHFGFRDGLSQPILPGLGKQGSPGNPEIPAGEIVLGYENAYNELPDSPLVPAAWDHKGLLKPATEDPGFVDLGHNGTYLVFRQLKQNVPTFWKFLSEAVKRENPQAGTAEAVQLAAKMVGRWPSGAPMTCSPDVDRLELAEENDFRYHDDDEKGLKCPVGSHVRRANPRDALQGSKPEKAMKISQRHRILRRGRNFGPALVADFDPQKLIDAPDDGLERGLHFICLNTNIARQFEFIQHTWSDNSKFEGMYNDPDPLLGIKDTRNKASTHEFTIPQLPLRRKITGLQRHVDVVGGAYWFLPGLKALEFLAYLSPESNSHVI